MQSFILQETVARCLAGDGLSKEWFEQFWDRTIYDHHGAQILVDLAKVVVGMIFQSVHDLGIYRRLGDQSSILISGGGGGR